MDVNKSFECYRDAYVSFVYPRHLTVMRDEGGGRLGYFLRSQAKPGTESVTIDLAPTPGDATVDAWRRLITLRRETEDDVFCWSRVRAGTSTIAGRPIEYVAEAFNKRTSTHLFVWMLLWAREGGYVFVSLSGPGRFADHEERWAEVIRSIDVKRWTPDDKDVHRAEETVRRRLEERKKRRRGTRAFKQLASLLKSLPSELGYLSDAILDLAAQGTEEFDDTGDVSVFEEAIRRETEGLKMGEAVKLCKRHAEKLRDWLAKTGYESDRRVGAPVLAVSLLLKGANRILRGQRFGSKP